MLDLLGEKRSQTKEEIINSLLEREKNLGELSGEIGITKQALLKHLKELEEIGILKSFRGKKEGTNLQVKVYKLRDFSAILSVSEKGYAINFFSTSTINPRIPLVNQIPQKGYREEVLEYLKAIYDVKEPLSVVVFGSVAIGEATWKSDIDVVLFSDKWGKEKEKVLNRISDVGMLENIETSLNPHFKEYREIDKDGIMGEVKENGLLIYTSREDETLWNKLRRYQNI